jgi:hypothetical protein
MLDLVCDLVLQKFPWHIQKNRQQRITAFETWNSGVILIACTRIASHSKFEITIAAAAHHGNI